MDDPEGTYAPESPDFSAYTTTTASYAPDPFVSQPSTYQHHYSTRNSGQTQLAYHHRQPQAPAYAEDDLDDVHMDAASGSRSRRGKAKATSTAMPSAEVEIKTKFPVARIKRIMQADEDVGKVSQVTPIAVSKALELFMISMVSKATEEARSKKSKRVGTEHLKRAVGKEEEYDFLQEIISKVNDGLGQNDRTEDAPEAEHSKRKRNGGGVGGGRRKRNGEDST
ncbi:MAG: hypothetical protein M1816_004278 [Peltula sp. TS41687]|nr:MAG: hypothetical protein M1816_004278 [Peltula sp. TS41687]